DVIVTAQRIPVLTLESIRGLTTITREDLQNIPVQNIQDLLSYSPGVDVKKRGPEGAQADVSIRGGSFEQTLILINGVKVSDPQTGHNNMNLPVNMEDIERIEILKGQASSIYGPNALSGAINIITRKDKRNELLLNLSGGQNGFYKGGLSFSYPLGELANSISVSKYRTNGYRYNTDITATTMNYNSSMQFSSGSGNFSLGYTDKDFGANGFYSDRYPGQRERLKTFFSALGLNIGLGKALFMPRFYWRNNKDNYLLDYLKPEFYNNQHTTNSYGAELQTSMITSFGSISLGCEIGGDDIKSSNLGDHKRVKGGISAEVSFSPINRLKIVLGAFIYNYDNYGWKYWPGIDLGYSLAENVNIYCSVGKSFRIPTFTELHYSSPAQVGNPLLHPEQATTYETGVNYKTPAVTASASAFLRKASDLIDWIRSSSDKPWHAENIASINTHGFDFSVSCKPELLFSALPFQKVSLNYAYLSSDLKTGIYQSRYVLDHLRHQFTAEVQHILPLEIKMSWLFRYENRFNQQDYFLTDSKLFYNYGAMEVFLQAENLFNTSYSDFSGIPMPGRWITGGIKMSINTI
ncbi:MAG: TonB-dependent receptor plug domain-containing protein, partial [Ignavibacteriales bacterium]